MSNRQPSRSAVSADATDDGVGLEHGRRHAALAEHVRGGETGRPGADDDNGVTGTGRLSARTVLVRHCVGVSHSPSPMSAMPESGSVGPVRRSGRSARHLYPISRSPARPDRPPRTRRSPPSDRYVAKERKRRRHRRAHADQRVIDDEESHAELPAQVGDIGWTERFFPGIERGNPAVVLAVATQLVERRRLCVRDELRPRVRGERPGAADHRRVVEHLVARERVVTVAGDSQYRVARARITGDRADRPFARWPWSQAWWSSPATEDWLRAAQPRPTCTRLCARAGASPCGGARSRFRDQDGHEGLPRADRDTQRA